jgi:hypothetical protein
LPVSANPEITSGVVRAALAASLTVSIGTVLSQPLHQRLGLARQWLTTRKRSVSMVISVVFFITVFFEFQFSQPSDQAKHAAGR